MMRIGGSGGVGGGVGVGAVQARNIYIYIFIIQKLLRGSKAATRRLFAVME